MKFNTKILKLMFLTFACSLPVYSENPKDNIIHKDSSSKLSAHISIGNISGEANEYLYYPSENRTVSQLIWNIDSLHMVDLGVAYETNNFNINANISLPMGDGESKMVDYDWQVSNLPWTDRSIHPNTIVSDAMILDIYSEVGKLKINDKATVSFLLGYKYESYSWEARGGSYIYSAEKFRDTIGSFNNSALGISYEQIWSVPYVGVDLNTQLKNVHFNMQIKYSPFADGKMTDLHHFRNLKIIDTFEDTTMLGLNVGMKYNIDKNYSLGINYIYTKYSTTTGDMEWIENGRSEYYSDYVGADLKTSNISLTVEYRF
jgi:outer membrane protease